MKLILTEDYAALSRAAADLFVSAVQAKPNAAIVVATGNSPVGMYRELAKRYQAGQLDLSQTRHHLWIGRASQCCCCVSLNER